MLTPDTLHSDPSGSSAEALSFQELWRKGLAAIQEMAAERWTDYNAHDPGVTILEQVCYALTECGYKSGFPVPDYLVGPDGTIDCDKQALYGPEKILPCRPVTPRDYRMAILDAVSDVDDVHLETAADGLYTIHLRLSGAQGEKSGSGPNGSDPEEIVKTVAAIYCDNRNLCEDIAGVRIISPAVYSLKGRIETDGRGDSAELLARIYYCCTRLVSADTVVASYAEAIRQGRSLEHIFEGPVAGCGRKAQYVGDARRRPMTLSDIFGAVREIPGVTAIHELALVDARGNSVETVPPVGSGTAVSLSIPDSFDTIGVRLVKKTKIYPVSVTAFRTAYDRMIYRSRPRPMPVRIFRTFLIRRRVNRVRWKPTLPSKIISHSYTVSGMTGFLHRPARSGRPRPDSLKPTCSFSTNSWPTSTPSSAG